MIDNLIGRLEQIESDSDNINTAHICGKAAEVIVSQAKRIAELEAAMREIYEVYAGSEGFIPETCPEAYQQQLIKEMAEIAAKYMRIRYGE